MANILGMDTVASETSELVGKNVGGIRKKAGLTQAALAETCGISAPRISEVESGRFNPTIDTLETIAKALGVDVISLFRPRRQNNR